MKGSITYQYEDEENDRLLTLEIKYTYIAGEPMVMYYADGSGYPGSAAEIEFYEARCTHIDEGRTTESEAKTIGDWFIENKVESEYDCLAGVVERDVEARSEPPEN